MRETDFEHLYAEHAQDLLAFLVYRTGNRATAEDILADTFEKVLRKHSRFDRRKAREKTWIYAIALNCLRDQARHTSAESRALERVGTPASGRGESGYDAVDDRDALQRGLHTLTDEEREAVSLRYGADLSMPDIAKLTGEPLTTVEGRIYRALRKLRDELG